MIASLRGETLFRVRIKDKRVAFAEPIPIGERIRYVHQHTDGRIILWTDSKLILSLSVSAQSMTDQFIEDFLSELSRERANSLQTTIDVCGECHSFEVGDNTTAPSLATVFAADISSSSFLGYSDALRSRGGSWTKKNLISFLSNPGEFAPGTSMPDPNLSAATIEDFVYFMDRLATERGPAENSN